MRNGRYTHPDVKRLIHLLRKLDDYLEVDSPVNNYMALQLITSGGPIWSGLREVLFARCASDKFYGEWNED